MSKAAFGVRIDGHLGRRGCQLGLELLDLELQGGVLLLQEGALLSEVVQLVVETVHPLLQGVHVLLLLPATLLR